MKFSAKRITAIIIVSFLILSCVAVGIIFPRKQRPEYFGDETVPLDSPLIPVTQNEYDLRVMPDKYNTGCNAAGITTVVTGPGFVVNGISISSYGKDTDMAIYITNDFPDVIVFENVDFSVRNLILTRKKSATNEPVFKFVNCKFSYFRTTELGDSSVMYTFENCTFTRFAGSNCSFNGCYFGGGNADGLNPVRNCFFTNCMIADLVHPSDTRAENHIDGIQLFGDSSANGYDCTNVHMDNCRIEVPYIPYSVPGGLMNCPITFTMKYGNATNMSFKNCYVNGGTYHSIMIYQDVHSISDVLFENVSVGGAKKNRNVIGNDNNEATLVNVHDTESLFIGSVWKDTDGIHLSVTNDTNQDRTLQIITSAGEYTKEIPACPVSYYLEPDSMSYSDFPFDMDICIGQAPDNDTDWIVCYDVTDPYNPLQIRFVNWSDNSVYVPNPAMTVSAGIIGIGSSQDGSTVSDISDNITSDGITSDNTISDDIIISGDTVISGDCGDDIVYTLYSNGVLELSGTGSTYNYHSKNTSPWYDYRDTITAVVIGDGITALGNQLFSRHSAIARVSLPSSLTTIGANTFHGCSSLTEICFPEGIATIGRYAFHSSGLKTVYCNSTSEDWKLVYIDDYNTPLINADYHFKAAEEAVTALYSGICGDAVTWTLSGNGRLTLEGEGETYNYHSKLLPPWNDYKASITSVYVSDGITYIGTQLFRNCSNITEVYIGEGVACIGGNCFSGCTSLSDISLPKSLTDIARYAFNRVPLKEINYSGTLDSWNAISIGDNNGTITSAVINAAN